MSAQVIIVLVCFVAIVVYLTGNALITTFFRTKYQTHRKIMSDLEASDESPKPSNHGCGGH